MQNKMDQAKKELEFEKLRSAEERAVFD